MSMFFPAPLEVWVLRGCPLETIRLSFPDQKHSLPYPLHPNPVWLSAGILFSPFFSSLMLTHAHLQALPEMSGPDKSRAKESSILGCPIGEGAERPVGGSGLATPVEVPALLWLRVAGRLEQCVACGRAELLSWGQLGHPAVPERGIYPAHTMGQAPGEQERPSLG